MSRELTIQEREWLIRGLSSLETGEYFGGNRWIDTKTGEIKAIDEPIDPKFWLDQIDNLRVVGKCGCGKPSCHTVQFQNFEKGKIETIVSYYTEDKRILNISIHEDSGLLAELEIIKEKMFCRTWRLKSTGKR